jgi:hypothetical protein
MILQKKIFKTLILVTVVLVAVIGVTLVVDATQRTKSSLFATSTDFSTYAYTTHTFAGPDTITWNIHFPKPSPATGAETIGHIAVLTSNETGSSVISFRVRYEVSQDNVNWKSFTLGTDSTTFYTALTGSNYLVNLFAITQSTHNGWQPYSRLRVWQGATGDTNKVKLYVLPQ